MVKKTILDCGLTIISETLGQFSTFSLSYTLKSGPRGEGKGEKGIHHLIEHMIFKGSQEYSMKEIANLSDCLGGHLNAFTSKEITQYYIKAIDEKFETAFHLLTDMVLHSQLPQAEFSREKNIVIQEIRESEDNPDSEAFESFYEDTFENNSLGYPIAGKVTDVSAHTRSYVWKHYKEKYQPGNLILAATGQVEHDQLVQLAQKSFSHYSSMNVKDIKYEKPLFKKKGFVKNKESINQAYVIIGFPGVAFTSTKKHQFLLMNDIFGSGMSSRLFQKIREEKSLAYTISSFHETYVDCGIHFIYAIIEPDKIEAYLKAVKKEILTIKKQGVSKAELSRAKDHLKSSLIMGLENINTKMLFNVNQELFLKQELDLQIIINNINQTSQQDIIAICNDNLDFERSSILIYGKGKKKHINLWSL